MKLFSCLKKMLALGVPALSIAFGAGAAPDAPGLEGRFQSPPAEARPLTWWHWINGNITKDGITKDLEAMKQAGLAGCYLFDVALGFPEGPVRFMQPEWLAMMDHTVSEAKRLGLTFGVHNCDGWEASGGPWIRPVTSMKKLTWSVTEVQGPGPAATVLPRPEANLDFYHDIAVVAYPVPAGGRLNGPGSGATVRGGLPAGEAARLADGDPATVAAFAAGTTHTIELVLPRAQTARSLVFSGYNAFSAERDFPVVLEASADGRDFRKISTFTINWDLREFPRCTVSFNDTRAKSFRLVFNNPWALGLGEIELSDAARTQFGEAKAGLVRQRGHGGETRAFDLYPGPDRGCALPQDRVLRRADVRILTDKMSPDGKLDWAAPAGRWQVLRVGYTSTGRQNAPANVEGRGLECDKFDPDIVRFHLGQYVGKLRERYGAAAGQAFSVFETDSWECGIQNWTTGLEGRFQKQVGYDLLTFLPLLTEGWVIDDYDTSERLLWDWRRFLADQIAAYFADVARFAKAAGLTYVAEGSGRQQYLYDPLVYQRTCDIPMGEFWAGGEVGSGVRVDNKVAASIAHLTGRRVVASESYTSPATWDHHPFSLKALGDRAYCAGVNRFVFHTFAHQPYTLVGPGFTMGPWGLCFNRANIWWEPARAWIEYLTRCNGLLQEGRFQADVLAFIGEDAPNRVGWREDLEPALPAGYDFDACDAQAILDATVRDGRIIMPSGMEYRVLLLPARRMMRPVVLEKILKLVQAGAVVLGPRVTQSPSLRDAGAGDRAVKRLAGALWGDAVVGAGEREVGRGRVFSGCSFERVFQRLGLTADFACAAAGPEAEILYLHRRIGEADVYFLSNQREATENFTATFRAGARAPELWDPATGEITRPGVYETSPEATRVPLRLDPCGSVFVIFREPARERHVVAIQARDRPALAQGERAGDRDASAPPPIEVVRDGQGGLLARVRQSGPVTLRLSDGTESRLEVADVPAALELGGPWQVEFPPRLGAPPAAEMKELASWSGHSDPGIRYFSGTATYRKEFEIPAGWFRPDGWLDLDLGRVAVIAQVKLNGQELGVLWKPPFRLNVSGAARPGRNTLEIRVTNCWTNRLIGDEQLPDDITWNRRDLIGGSWPEWLGQVEQRPGPRIAFVTKKVYGRDTPLLESGLLGPVRVTPSRMVGIASR